MKPIPMDLIVDLYDDWLSKICFSKTSFIFTLSGRRSCVF